MAAALTAVRVDPNVDQGWAFPFLLASLMCFTLIFGISYSSAIFYIVFLESFQGSPAATAWVVGLNTCANYLFLPICSVMNRHVGDAWCMIIGTVLSSLGLIGSMFATDLVTLGLTFGVLTGFGWASVFLGILHGLFLFFNRFRKIAVAIASLGTSLGQFVYPPFLEFLLHHFDWRGCLLILAGMNLNLFILVAIYHTGRGCDLAEKEAKLLVKPVDVKRSRLEDVKEILAVCKSCSYLLFNLSTVSAALAVGAFQTHITRTSMLSGLDTFFSAMLPSAIGAAGLAGRIAWGVIAQRLHRVSVLWLNVLCYTGLSVVVLVCVFFRSFSSLLCSAMLFGFLIGIWGLLPECIITIVGPELFVHALGINGLFSGLGLLIGPPFAGWLSESDLTYKLSFGISSALLMVAALLILPSAYKATWSEALAAKRRQSEAVNFEL